MECEESRWFLSAVEVSKERELEEMVESWMLGGDDVEGNV